MPYRFLETLMALRSVKSFKQVHPRRKQPFNIVFQLSQQKPSCVYLVDLKYNSEFLEEVPVEFERRKQKLGKQNEKVRAAKRIDDVNCNEEQEAHDSETTLSASETGEPNEKKANLPLQLLRKFLQPEKMLQNSHLGKMQHLQKM